MSGPTTRVQAIAILSPRNTPIYVRQLQPSSSSSADLRYHYFAHAGLDVIEERAANLRNLEQYLGLLYTLEDLAVYGFQTSTRVKILLMLTLSDGLVRDIDVLTVSQPFKVTRQGRAVRAVLTPETRGQTDAACGTHSVPPIHGQPIPHATAKVNIIGRTARCARG